MEHAMDNQQLQFRLNSVTRIDGLSLSATE
jgi:hypothetical protein